MREIRAFISYTGDNKPEATHIRTHLKGAHKIDAFAYHTDEFAAGKLTDKIVEEMQSCNLYLLLLTRDYRDRTTKEELDWLISNLDVTQRENLPKEKRHPRGSKFCVVPLLLDEDGEEFWFEHSPKGGLEENIHHRMYDTENGCFVLNGERSLLHGKTRTKLASIIADVREELDSLETLPPPTRPPPPAGPPRICVFGGICDDLPDNVEVAKARFLENTNADQEHGFEIQNFGNDWSDRRQKRSNSKVTNRNLKHLYPLIVADANILEMVSEETETIIEDIYQNFGRNLGGHRKRLPIWIPDSSGLEIPESFKENDDKFVKFFLCSEGDILAEITDFFGLDSLGAFYAEEPGKKYLECYDIAQSAIRETMEVELYSDYFNVRDEEPQVSILVKMINEFLTERRRNPAGIFIVLTDERLHIEKYGPMRAKKIIKSRLMEFEKEFAEKLKEQNWEFEIARVFVQARNKNRMNDLDVKWQGKKHRWLPLRIDRDTLQPDDDCIEKIIDDYGAIFNAA